MGGIFDAKGGTRLHEKGEGGERGRGKLLRGEKKRPTNQPFLESSSNLLKIGKRESERQTFLPPPHSPSLRRRAPKKRGEIGTRAAKRDANYCGRRRRRREEAQINRVCWRY